MRRSLLSLALLLAACGGSSPESTTTIDFEGNAPTVDGGEVSLGDYADRDLVVWFWAPW